MLATTMRWLPSFASSSFLLLPLFLRRVVVLRLAEKEGQGRRRMDFPVEEEGHATEEAPHFGERPGRWGVKQMLQRAGVGFGAGQSAAASFAGIGQPRGELDKFPSFVQMLMTYAMRLVLKMCFSAFVFCGRDTPKNNDQVRETVSSRRKNRDRKHIQIPEHDYSLDVPVRSAPTSPFSSPKFSPHDRVLVVWWDAGLLQEINPSIASASWSKPPFTKPTISTTLLTPKPESQPIKGQWQKGKLIGRGTFGSVYVATNRETGALCAMKEVELFPDDPKSAECIKQLQQEIKVLSQLKHPNIVQYYGSEIVDDRFFIYLEYVHPGSINKYVHEHCGAITEAVVRSFTRHILSGLAYLHSTKTIHRDIKGANLLVDSFGVVKLADFGMAKHLSGHVGNLSLKGSPYWMAPELMQSVMHKDNSSDLALAVDIWSLGCTIIEMLTGKPPWSEYEGAAAMFKVMKDTPPIPETLSPEAAGCPSLTHASNGMNFMDRPQTPIELERRVDHSLMIPGFSMQLTTGKAVSEL
ncbi:hypothetical protein M0R45_001420 [Rubus argutus]|uniref:mitogen-activated protein kinase kinase kinase n=1 Tax=Rubus argutus TaxID=59490 RepID=A0AAW1VKQ4_RUBAR